MSTWSAPMAYNLMAFSSVKRINTSQENVVEPLSIEGTFADEADAYGYLIPWNQRGAPKALAKLWEKGYRVRVAEDPFETTSSSYDAGTLIILAGRNLDKAAAIISDLKEISQECQVAIHAVNSGRVRTGPDLASRKSQVLHPPKIALMVEPPFSTYTSGQLYYLFDFETELPVDRIRPSILSQSSIPKFGSRYGQADLSDYDVLILPGGGNGLNDVFDEKARTELAKWIRSGGVVVATESATDFFTKKNFEFTQVEMNDTPSDTSQQAKYLAYDERQDYWGKKRVPGAALRGILDTSHPLAFGMSSEIYSLGFRSTGIEPKSNLSTVGYYHKNADHLLASGYASEENLENLAGKAFAAVKNIGAGKIVYLTDNTQYRMFWRGPSRMMQNAVMLLPSF